MPGKKQPAPECVGGELSDEQAERQLPGSRIPGVPPYEPGCQRHREVQNSPHAAENPARWSPGRTSKFTIDAPASADAMAPAAAAVKHRSSQPTNPSACTDRGFKDNSWFIEHLTGSIQRFHPIEMSIFLSREDLPCHCRLREKPHRKGQCAHPRHGERVSQCMYQAEPRNRSQRL